MRPSTCLLPYIIFILFAPLGLFAQKTVTKGLEDCSRTIYRNPETWDRDATPHLSMIYLNLERLVGIVNRVK